MGVGANIILVGFMGTGKTTVGRLLAERQTMEFVDMDCVIEERAGKPISRIFEEDGEPHFRELESQLARELAKRGGLVIAAGGGVVLKAENMKAFEESGRVVCLTASPETILKRVETDSGRPLLEGGDKRRMIADKLNARKHLYDEMPIRIDTTSLSPEAVVKQIVDLS